jgi:N-acetylglucosamine kinase-like BadF-type ATPase
MSLYLGIDAGGSKTRCALADETQVLARASTGTVKLMRVSEEEATARLRRMLDEVVDVAGASLGEVRRSCLGLAGIGSAAVRAWAAKTMADLAGGELILCGDEEIALEAAFAGGPGILVVAGTGSNAIGRTASGGSFGAGGWGPVLGDEGSGTWIGLEAIRAALRAQDRIGLGGVSTCLLREIERHWGVESLAELVALANRRGDAGGEAPDFATLAPVVARCAEQGDSLAAGVLERAGEELAGLVALVFHKMTAHAADAGGTGAQIGVAFTGSVLAEIAAVRTAMVARLEVSLPVARVRSVPVDPLEGALWRARQG